MTGGTVTTGYYTFVGDGSTNNVTFDHSAGTLDTAGLLVERSGTGGTYNLSGTASLIVSSNNFQVGGFGTGYFNQSGGSVSVTGATMYVGNPGVGTYTMTGGTLGATNTA